MSLLLSVAGAKGGTGKSTILRYLVTWLQDAGIEPMLIDCDDENATMSRFFAQAIRIEPRRPKSYDDLVNLIVSGRSLLTIADIKAGTGHDMLPWYDCLPYEELKELGIRIAMLGVITSSPDSVSSLLRWIDALGDRVRWIVVKSLKDSDATGLDPENVPFPEYDLTLQAIEFRKRYSPKHIIMPGLDPDYQSELERCRLTIRDVLARNPKVPESLSSLLVRARLRRYQEGLYEQFDRLKKILLP